MQNDGQNDGGIHQKSVVEEGLTDDAQIRKHGQFGLEGFIDHALRRRAAIENIHAEEVGNAMPNVVSARPVTFWLARRLMVRKL